MHLKPSAVSALAVAVTAALLAACSTGGSAITPQSGGPVSSSAFGRMVVERGSFARALHAPPLRIVDPSTLTAQIYVGQYGGASAPGEINDYNANNSMNQPPFCRLTGLTAVNGIGVDGGGELWVPMETASGVNQVLSYAPGCGAAGKTLSDPNGEPNDIAFASDGTRYVSDIVGNGSTAGDISVYPKNKTSPTKKLTASGVFFSQGAAVDSHGNVFQAWVSSNEKKGGIIEFPGGATPAKHISGVNIVIPGTPIFDKHDKLIVSDDKTLTLNVYAPPYTTASKKISLQGSSSQCALDKNETNIACADRGNNTVDVYSYPGGTYKYSFSSGLLPNPYITIGIAQDPSS